MLCAAYLILIMFCHLTYVHAASGSKEITFVSEDVAACFTEYEIEIPGARQHYEFIVESCIYPDTVRGGTPPFTLMDGVFGFAASPDKDRAKALAVATASGVRKLYRSNLGTADFIYEDWSFKASQRFDKTVVDIPLRKASSVIIAGFKSISLSRPTVWLLGPSADDLCNQPLIVPCNMMPLMRDIRYVHGPASSMHERLEALEEHAKTLCEDALVTHVAKLAMLDIFKFQAVIIQKLTHWRPRVSDKN